MTWFGPLVATTTASVTLKVVTTANSTTEDVNKASGLIAASMDGRLRDPQRQGPRRQQLSAFNVVAQHVGRFVFQQQGVPHGHSLRGHCVVRFELELRHPVRRPGELQLNTH